MGGEERSGVCLQGGWVYVLGRNGSVCIAFTVYLLFLSEVVEGSGGVVRVGRESMAGGVVETGMGL